MGNDWKLIFIVPNLNIKNPIECDNLALVPFSDQRLIEIQNKCLASKALLTKFSNQFGTAIKPCAIILNDNTYRWQINKIIDFRNIIAFCSIIEGYKYYISRGQSLEPTFSDFFDFYPITPSVNGKELVVHTPIQLGTGNPDNFTGQISPLVVYTHFNTATIDESILSLLLRLWKRNLKKKSWKSRAIFRSLQIVYQASTIYFDNPFSEFDIGSRIGLWVSAFEVLVHPGGRQEANLRVVLDSLGQYSFSERELKQKRYKVGKYSVNLIQKIYSQLYNSRNAFLHGNPIINKHQYPFGDRKKKSFLIFAPLIYKAALTVELSRIGIRNNRRGLTSLILCTAEEKDYEDAIIKCFKG